MPRTLSEVLPEVFNELDGVHPVVIQGLTMLTFPRTGVGGHVGHSLTDGVEVRGTEGAEEGCELVVFGDVGALACPKAHVTNGIVDKFTEDVKSVFVVRHGCNLAGMKPLLTPPDNDLFHDGVADVFVEQDVDCFFFGVAL